MRSALTTLLCLFALALVLAGCKGKRAETLESINLDLQRIPRSQAQDQLLGELHYRYRGSVRFHGKLLRHLVEKTTAINLASDGSGKAYIGAAENSPASSYGLILFQVRPGATLEPVKRTIRNYKNQKVAISLPFYLWFRNLTICMARVAGQAPQSYEPFRDIPKINWMRDARKRQQRLCIGRPSPIDKSIRTGIGFRTQSDMERFVSVLTSAYPDIQIR